MQGVRDWNHIKEMEKRNAKAGWLHDPSSQVSPKNKYLSFHFKNTACFN